ATVAAKLYLTEAGTDHAQTLAGSGEDFCAPGIVRLEVLSAISRRYRMGGISAPDAEAMMAEWLEDLESGSLKLWSDDVDLDSALRLSIRIKHPLVDCLYVACAMRLGTELLTADEKLHARA